MGAVALESQLPSFYELLHRFSLFDSSASSRCDVQIGSNGSVFCRCEGCVGWRDFVKGRDPCDAHVKYEVFTREHVAGLACYLRSRAAEYNLSVMEVLEVGAGNGRLSLHLNKSLSRLFDENQGPLVRVTATDSGARGLNGPAVENEDAIHAITRRKPHVVLSSWMPRGIDWTAHMRAEQSVYEYILIGEIDHGICGCSWQTWGFSSAWSDSDDSDSDSLVAESKDSGVVEENEVCSGRSNAISGRPQYERDGWERVELASLSRVQLCRTDERWSTRRHSHTVSFRKT